MTPLTQWEAYGMLSGIMRDLEGDRELAREMEREAIASTSQAKWRAMVDFGADDCAYSQFAMGEDDMIETLAKGTT